jgi:hypothetical protein
MIPLCRVERRWLAQNKLLRLDSRTGLMIRLLRLRTLPRRQMVQQKLRSLKELLSA